MKVLVTGGAGYIGSHAVKRLHEAGHRPIVIDNLYRGHREAVHAEAEFVKGDVRDVAKVTSILRDRQIDCVMHFGALAYVGESVDQPLDYYSANTQGVIALLQAIDAAGVTRMVFSSTCATYGEPEVMPITEDLPQRPINPYGWSKLMCERVLIDYAHATPTFGFAAPRYFNVAGSAEDGSIGEDHKPETHLIPRLLLTALGKYDKASIFGDDYATPDGTCVRDYVHVQDLVDAHILLMESLNPGDQRFYNLGIGRGYSVREVVDAVKRVTGSDFPVDVAGRRPGDPPTLYADASRIQRELGWEAKLTDLDHIVETAWRWLEAHPDGYATSTSAE